MIRVYLALTPGALADAVRTGTVEAPAFAVTAALREWYAEGDTEELEHAALLEAAHACLGVLGATSGPMRRVVVAADVANAVPYARAGRAAVSLAGPVPWERAVSLHVDAVEATADVAAAVASLPAAEAGDDDAAFVVDGADGHDLLWFDVTEVDGVVADLGA